MLVLSENANELAFVKREVERAVSKGKPVFPIRVREVLPSKALELFVSSAHWIDAWKPPLEKYLERLAEAISAASGACLAGAKAAGPIPIKAGVSSTVGSPRRILMLSSAAIVALLIGGAGWYAYCLVDKAGPALSRNDQRIEAKSNTNLPSPMKSDAVREAAAQVPPSQATTGGPEACPSQLGLNPNLPTPFTCTCSEAAAEAGIVAGTDVYADLSSLCRAAVHAGAITAKGGPITVVRSEGRPYYVGSSRNGVQTADYGRYTASITFPGTESRSSGPEACPSQLGLNPNLPTPFTCTCSEAAAEAGIVAGTDVYADLSSLCRAAVHAGAITAKGGPITVVRSEGRPYYVGSSRNGVQTAITAAILPVLASNKCCL